MIKPKLRVRLSKGVAKIAIVSLVGLWATSACLLWILWNMLMNDGRVVVQELNRFILIFEIGFFSAVSIACFVGFIWLISPRK